MLADESVGGVVGSAVSAVRAGPAGGVLAPSVVVVDQPLVVVDLVVSLVVAADTTSEVCLLRCSVSR